MTKVIMNKIVMMNQTTKEVTIAVVVAVVVMKNQVSIRFKSKDNLWNTGEVF